MKKLVDKVLAFLGFEAEVSRWFKQHGNRPINEIVKIMNKDELVTAHEFFRTRQLREASCFEVADMDGYCFVDYRVRSCLDAINNQLLILHKKG